VPIAFSDGWRLGKPDLIVRMPRPFRVPAEGPDFTRCFVLSLNLSADTWVRAVEFRPGTPRVVRHALIFPDTAHMVQLPQARSGVVGFAPTDDLGLVSSNPYHDRMPGSLPTFLIPGVARRLKVGADLVLLTHFHPDGKPESEQSSVGLYLSKEPPQRQFAVVPLGSSRIFIRAGVKDYKVRAAITLPVDVEAVGILLHARTHCTAIKSVATLPNGVRKPLLWIEDWDYDRPDTYRYAHPIVLPAGTRLSVEFTYDNSADNPRNPNSPPQFVMWGAQTVDEIAGQWLQVVLKRSSDRERLARAVSAAALIPTTRNIGSFQGKYRFRIWPLQHPFNGDYSPHPDLGERRSNGEPSAVSAASREDRNHLPQ
jgi:hypothetical protein